MEAYCLTVGELASHAHVSCIYNQNNQNYTSVITTGVGYLSDGVLQWSTGAVKTAGEGTGDPCGITKDTGNNEMHNNISPCVGAYLWRRTT